MIDYCQFVHDNVDRRVALEQLAEEASELSQAALKLIRAEGLSDNPTPVKSDDAINALFGEFADVLMCMSLLWNKQVLVALAENIDESEKWKRWAKRITASW